MKRLFHRLDGAGGRQSPVTSPALPVPSNDPSSVKDFIGKVFNVNKHAVVVEDVIAEGVYSVSFFVRPERVAGVAPAPSFL